MLQQYANNEEKSKKGTDLIQQYANNEEKSRKGTDLIQPFASEKKHSRQSGSDQGLQICKTDVEEVLLLKMLILNLPTNIYKSSNNKKYKQNSTNLPTI